MAEVCVNNSYMYFETLHGEISCIVINFVY